jgi:putative tricarboxylic transport membrane protein
MARQAEQARWELQHDPLLQDTRCHWVDVCNVLATLALRFGPPEYSLLCAAIAVTYLARGSTVKALMMAGAGIIFANAGLDLITGLPRFTFGFEELTDGIKLPCAAMGLFGISEVFVNLEKTMKTDIYKTKYSNLWPSLKDWADSIWSILEEP